jgi:hypothetical protein
MASQNVLEGAAETLGGQLAESAAGPIGAFAFGQLLSWAGLGDNSQAEMQAALNQIIQQIAVLQQSIDQLHADMEAAMTQIQYDVVAQPVNALIASNETLLGLFATLAGAPADELADQRASIVSQMGPSIVTAPQTWHDTMTGNTGTTGIIQAWNQVVHTHYPFFDAQAANAIAQHWAYLDAHQTQSVMYCVEWMNHQGNPAGAVQTLLNWREHRIAQLGMLRGMPWSLDRYIYVDGNPDAGRPNAERIATELRSLPPGVTITSFEGAPMMYYLTLMGPIAHGNSGSDFNSAYQECVNTVADVTDRQGQGDQVDDSTLWNIPSPPQMIDFLNFCGGSVGGGGADHFADALSTKNFTGAGGQQLRLWTDFMRNPDGTPLTIPIMPFGRPMPMGEARSVFVDGDSWWNPSTDPNDTAWLLFQRRLSPGEADDYWYPNP